MFKIDRKKKEEEQNRKDEVKRGKEIEEKHKDIKINVLPSKPRKETTPISYPNEENQIANPEEEESDEMPDAEAKTENKKIPNRRLRTPIKSPIMSNVGNESLIILRDEVNIRQQQLMQKIEKMKVSF